MLNKFDNCKMVIKFQEPKQKSMYVFTFIVVLVIICMSIISNRRQPRYSG